MILNLLMNGNKFKKVFISEIASSHGGSITNLNKLVNQLLFIDTDFVKFQIFKNNHLCHNSSKLYNNLKKIEIPFKNWKKIISKTLRKKNVILEPFDQKSYEFCKKFKKKVLLKISCSEHDNIEMIKDATKNFKKIFINISGYNISRFENIVKKNKLKKNKIVLMYGFQSFPTNPKDLRMGIIKKIKTSRFQTGYADHSNTVKGNLSYKLTSSAIKFGAKYIEKHVTLNRKKRGPDYITSLEPDEMNDYVNFFKFNLIKKNIALKNKISNSEKQYCKIMKKYCVVKKKLSKGDIPELKNLVFLRTGKEGMTRDKIFKILNQKRKIKRDIKKNSVLTVDYF